MLKNEWKMPVNKYYSEYRGLVRLKYPTNLVFNGEQGAYIEYGGRYKMRVYEKDSGHPFTFLLLDDNTRISGQISRLVYSNACGEIPKHYEIEHIDGNKRNNAPENLRLVRKIRVIKNRRVLRGEEKCNTTITNEQAREILELVLTHQKAYSQIAKEYGVSKAVIRGIRKGTNWASVNKDIFEKYG